jgi:glycosyltransferase involved in cell wall biosynthesis
LECFVSKNILIDALQAVPAAAGVGRYTLEAARGVARLRSDVTVLIREGMREQFGEPSDCLVSVDSLRGAWDRILYEQLRLPGLAKEYRLVHFPDSACALRRRAPYLMTVHDLSFYARPGTFTTTQTAWKKLAARMSAKRAEFVICVSEHTAKDVATWLHVPKERIRVVYPGVTVHEGEALAPNVTCPEGPFVLGVGTLEPRKNFVRLIEAVARLRKEGLRLDLVIAGRPGWMYRDILRAPRELGIQDAVTFAGYCTDAQLKWLYQHASLLAYVSLYEGFGFPPLEAMTYDLPVIGADVSSIPEVCGDAAIYVDPDSTEGLARAIRNAHEDGALRDKLIQAGRERTKMFSWQETARRLSAIYDEAMTP